MRHPDIPKWPYLLFKWFCSESFFEELQGDLEENFLLTQEKVGKAQARKVYLLEIIKLMRPSVVRKVSVFPATLGRLTSNYILTSVRAFKYNPGYILSNIFGLAIALSFCTIGYFYLRFNQTFNSHYTQAEYLYKIHGQREAEATIGSSAIAMAPSLLAAGYEAMRYQHQTVALRDGNKLFQESTVFADPRFLEYFELISVSGKKLQLTNANEIFISQKMAKKLFGEPYPVNELITIVFPNQKEQSFVIKDVFIDPPQNVSFHFPMITAFENYVEFFEVDENDWSAYIDGTFVYLNGVRPEQVEAQLDGFKELHNTANPDRHLVHFRLDNILVWPSFETTLAGRSFWNHLNSASVWGTVSTAFAILLLACFNFINTSIALSGKRLKEIAVRKVMGGNRRSTIAQFMTENLLMVSSAVLLSVILSYFLIPAYNGLMTQEIVQVDRVPLNQLIYFAIGLILFVSLLSGAYPSFYISRFSSLKIFRDKLVISGKNRLMMVLLTFQFALCFYNFASLYVNVENAYYQESIDRGYDIDQVINIPLNEASQLPELEYLLNQHPKVVKVAGTQNMIGSSYETSVAKINGENMEVVDLAIGVDYADVLGLRLIKGSMFSEQYATSKNQLIINKLMEETMGKDLLNTSITYGNEKYTVVGVVEDFNLRPMMFSNRVKPTILRASPESKFQYASIRVEGSPLALHSEVEEIWYSLFPQQLYEGFLQEKVMDSVRETNKIMVYINLWSSIVTILISALGLYTLIALTVQKRSKEFGIRKVLGASKHTIIGLLGKDLYWILGIAMVMGLTSAYFVITSVFDIIYAYHIELSFFHYFWACITLFVIVAFTIGFKVNNTGKLNPVDQLRME